MGPIRPLKHNFLKLWRECANILIETCRAVSPAQIYYTKTSFGFLFLERPIEARIQTGFGFYRPVLSDRFRLFMP